MLRFVSAAEMLVVDAPWSRPLTSSSAPEESLSGYTAGSIFINLVTEPMRDKYVNFAELSSSEPDGAFRIEVRRKESAVALIAPHGGKIEPGTSDICRSVAGEDLTYYLFEGCKSNKNRNLHITSSRFDEPQGIDVARSAQVVVAFHGQNASELFVNVGGLATRVCASVICHLQIAGFKASQHDDPNLQGRDKNNICNRGSKGQGLQLEISRGLRDVLTSDKSAMSRFSSAIRSALDEVEQFT